MALVVRRSIHGGQESNSTSPVANQQMVSAVCLLEARVHPSAPGKRSAEQLDSPFHMADSGRETEHGTDKLVPLLH